MAEDPPAQVLAGLRRDHAAQNVLRREALGVVLDPVVQPVPLLDDDDARERPLALGPRQEARPLVVGAGGPAIRDTTTGVG